MENNLFNRRGFLKSAALATIALPTCATLRGSQIAVAPKPELLAPGQQYRPIMLVRVGAVSNGHIRDLSFQQLMWPMGRKNREPLSVLGATFNRGTLLLTEAIVRRPDCERRLCCIVTELTFLAASPYWLRNCQFADFGPLLDDRQRIAQSLALECQYRKSNEEIA